MQKIKEDSVVFDGATNLIWQRSGSKTYLSYENAKKYINNLNNDGFAGSKNWRLPTLEEAMSLMETEETNGLFIDPIFDDEKEFIWTADLVEGKPRAAWVVIFSRRSCGWIELDLTTYVRAVRSRQSSTE